jgi:hypothetical protein
LRAEAGTAPPGAVPASALKQEKEASASSEITNLAVSSMTLRDMRLRSGDDFRVDESGFF